MDLVKKYANKAEEAAEEVKDSVDISDEDEKVQQAGRDLKSFVEKLSGKSLDDLTNAVQVVSLRFDISHSFPARTSHLLPLDHTFLLYSTFTRYSADK